MARTMTGTAGMQPATAEIATRISMREVYQKMMLKATLLKVAARDVTGAFIISPNGLGFAPQSGATSRSMGASGGFAAVAMCAHAIV